MVAFINISAYSSPPPKSGAGKIQEGPLYPLDIVKVAAKEGINLGTRDCVRNVRSLGLEEEGVGALVCQLSSDGYRDSEWCRLGSNNLIAACDSYVLRTREYNDNAYKYMNCEYFLKFTLKKSGDLVLVVSCHTSS